jgi:predicted HTH domain antitoxin
VEETKPSTVRLFETGQVSSGRAAKLAGITRVEFLLALRAHQISPFRMTAEELRQDVLNA